MRLTTTALTMATMLSVCGCSDGQWGSELRLDLVALGGPGAPVAGMAVELPGGGYRLELDRFCLSVEAVSVAPAAGGAEVPSGGGHSHGGENAGGAVAAASPVVQELDAVVDLSGGSTSLMRRGVWPGAYESALLTLAPAHQGAQFGATCTDLAGRILLLEGALVEIATGARRPVTLDLRADEHIMTEEIELDAEAPLDGTAELRLGLRLDAWLAPLAPVVAAGSAPLVVGGEFNQHPELVGQLLDGLSSGENYEVASP